MNCEIHDSFVKIVEFTLHNLFFSLTQIAFLFFIQFGYDKDKENKSETAANR